MSCCLIARLQHAHLASRFTHWVCGLPLRPLLRPLAVADHRDEKWEDEYRDGPCRVKEVSDKGDYKLEVKCPDGRGRTWSRGEWKDEYWDGPCRVKVEAKRDEYKKEVKC